MKQLAKEECSKCGYANHINSELIYCPHSRNAKACEDMRAELKAIDEKRKLRNANK